jgi:threonine dehydrogenase-like Zn-dependent dehydrogenase
MKLGGSNGKALRQEMAATRRGGTISVSGVYAGFIHSFLFGDAFEKGLAFKGGQTNATCPSCSSTSRKAISSLR